MVLPFLMIGKALKPLAKIKKQSWKAMGSAFGSMRKSVNPMKSFGKIMEILNVVMLPVTYFFTLLTALFLTKLMPIIVNLIPLIDDLAIMFEGLFEVIEGILSLDFDMFWAGVLKLFSDPTWWSWWLLWEAVIPGFKEMSVGLQNLSADLDFLGNIMAATEAVIEGFAEAWEDLMSLSVDFDFGGGGGGFWDYFNSPQGGFGYGGGGGGGGGGGFPDIPIPDIPSIPGLPNIGTTINIDLRGSIVNEREKLIKDITEQVSMRIW